MSARMPWFRMYADFLNDPKMIALAFEDQRHFIGVLALKCDGAIDDVADGNLLDRIVAQRLWIDHAIIRDVKRRLVAAGLIDANWQPLAWDRRQMRSDNDSTGAERQRRYRESRKGNALRNASSNAPVTRLDTDTDTDTEVIPPLPPTGGAPDGAMGVEQTFPDLVEPEAEVLQPSAGSACTTAGAACLALKAAGVADTNPGSPKLRALLEAGVDLQEIVGAAQKAAAAGNRRFTYVLGIVEGERKRAAEMAAQLHRGDLPATETAYQRSMRERVREFAPSLARQAPVAQQPKQSAVEFFNAIAVPARTVGALK